MILLSVTGGLRIIEMQRADVADIQKIKGQTVLFIQGKGHDEKDDYKACCLNVKHSCQIIEDSIQIQKDERDYGLRVMGALYHLENGEVEFFE